MTGKRYDRSTTIVVVLVALTGGLAGDEPSRSTRSAVAAVCTSCMAIWGVLTILRLRSLHLSGVWSLPVWIVAVWIPVIHYTGWGEGSYVVAAVSFLLMLVLTGMWFVLSCVRRRHPRLASVRKV